jgi:hypothetical protein
LAKALYQEAIMSTSGDTRKDPKKEGDTTGAKLISLTIRLSLSALRFSCPSKIFATKYIWCMVALSNHHLQ